MPPGSSPLKLILVDATVPQREAPPEEVVRGVRAQDLRREEFPGAVDGDGDVRHRRLVDHAQLLTRGAIELNMCSHIQVYFATNHLVSYSPFRRYTIAMCIVFMFMVLYLNPCFSSLLFHLHRRRNEKPVEFICYDILEEVGHVR